MTDAAKTTETTADLIFREFKRQQAGIPFPLTMTNLSKAARARGFDPDQLWPWLTEMPHGPDRYELEVALEAVNV